MFITSVGGTIDKIRTQSQLDVYMIFITHLLNILKITQQSQSLYNTK